MKPKPSINLTNQILKRYGIPKEDQPAYRDAAQSLVLRQLQTFGAVRHWLSLKGVVVREDLIREHFFNS